RPLLLSLAVLAVLACTPVRAAAITIDQIVALSKAGVSEAVILALLDRDRTILAIDADRVAALKREGLSDTVIVAMLRGRREEADRAAPAIPDGKLAGILSTLPPPSSPPPPDLVIVGREPQSPSTNYSSTGFRSGRSRRVYTPSVPIETYPSALPY